MLYKFVFWQAFVLWPSYDSSSWATSEHWANEEEEDTTDRHDMREIERVAKNEERNGAGGARQRVQSAT